MCRRTILQSVSITISPTKLVLEVAYSQDEDDLDNKVTRLFEQLPGRICTVLGVDVTYVERGERSRSSHSASVSLWTSQDDEGGGLEVRHVLDRQVFRTDDGQARPGNLTLPFDLFVPSRIRSQLPDLGPEADVRITFAYLSDLVGDAEQRQRDCEGTASPSPGPQPEHYKRVTFKRADGTVARVTQMPAERPRLESGGQETDEGLTNVVLGRTRSQSRSRSQNPSASLPRRSARLRLQSTNGGEETPD